MKKFLKVLLVIVLIIAIVAIAYFVTIKVQEKSALKAVDEMFTALKTGDSEELKQYINLESQNESEDSSTNGILEDNNMAKAIVQNLNYEVVSTDTKINNCTVNLNISNKDFKAIFSNYMQEAISLSFSQAFNGITEEEMDQQLEQYFIEQYSSEDIETVTNEITINMTRENQKWNISCDENMLLNSIMPGYQEITESLNQIDE